MDSDGGRHAGTIPPTFTQHLVWCRQCVSLRVQRYKTQYLLKDYILLREMELLINNIKTAVRVTHMQSLREALGQRWLCVCIARLIKQRLFRDSLWGLLAGRGKLKSSCQIPTRSVGGPSGDPEPTAEVFNTQVPRRIYTRKGSFVLQAPGQPLNNHIKQH